MALLAVDGGAGTQGILLFEELESFEVEGDG